MQAFTLKWDLEKAARDEIVEEEKRRTAAGSRLKQSSIIAAFSKLKLTQKKYEDSALRFFIGANLPLSLIKHPDYQQ